MVNYWLAKQEPSGPRGYNFEQLKKDKYEFAATGNGSNESSHEG